MPEAVLLLSCEHGGNTVPRPYRHAFQSAAARRSLASHEGYDIGAAETARVLARKLGAPLHLAQTSRLLIDLNRSVGHKDLFSRYSRSLTERQRDTLIERVYSPHRNLIQNAVDATIARRRHCVHVAVHSFTPELRGERREADIGLLYDPGREPERSLCVHWQRALRELDGTLRVRRNYPYLGTTDGLTTALRKRFAVDCYAGIELELNQALLGSTAARSRIACAVAVALRDALPMLGWRS